jgi:hypothetical protein
MSGGRRFRTKNGATGAGAASENMQPKLPKKKSTLLKRNEGYWFYSYLIGAV